MPAAMKRQLGWPALSVLTLWACSDARLLDGFSEGQTRIRVTPAAFIGNVPCVRGAAGALQSYVVQLQQVDSIDGEGDAGVAVTVSPPVPCDRAVTFPAVAARPYAADILGFDGDGSLADGGVLAPRWTASCGRATSDFLADAGPDPLGPTYALRGSTIPLRGCTTFDGSSVSTPSRLVVDVPSALGSLRCGNAPGEVAFLEATLGSARRTASCGSPLVFEIAAPGGFHSVALAGFEAPRDAGAVAVPDASDASTDASTLPPDTLDAAVLDAATLDAGPIAASTDGGLDLSDAGASVPPSSFPSGPPQWTTRCIGRSLAGVTRSATCDPFVRLPP